MQNKNQNSFEQFNLQVYCHQVSGKGPKFTDKSQKFIFKPYSQSEGKFYQYLEKRHIGDGSYLLSKYIPKFYGIFSENQILHQQNVQDNAMNNSSNNQPKQTFSELVKQQLSHLQTSKQRKQWIDHINSRSVYQKNQKFIKIENLTYGFKYPNIIDIKLGIKKKMKSMEKYDNNTTLSHCFRINGLSVRQFEKENHESSVQRFMSKYYCQQINEKQLNKHLAFFFFDGDKIHLKLLENVINDLKQLILGFLSFKGIKFMSSSLFIAYDAYNPQNYTLNFIDFDKYQQCQQLDYSVQLGLKNSLKSFISIKNSVTKIQAQLKNKQLIYFHKQHQVIPSKKKEKYFKVDQNE